MFGLRDYEEEVDEEEIIESVDIFEDTPPMTSLLLPPHQRCAAHTLNLVASKDSEKALEDPAFKTASRSFFAKAQAMWNKQSRTHVASGTYFSIIAVFIYV